MAPFGLLLVLYYVCYSTTISQCRDLRRTDAHKVYRIIANHNKQLDLLRKFEKSAQRLGLNFWEEPARLGLPVDVMAPPDILPAFERQLHEHGFNFTVLVDDVENLIKLKERPLESAWIGSALLRDSSSFGLYSSPFDLTKFHSYAEIVDFMEKLQFNNPHFVRTFSIGKTLEGRPIMTIQIGYPLGFEKNRAIWLDAGFHAREWLAPTTALYIMNELVTKYGIDPTVTRYVNKLKWYITPVVNPDGYEYTRSSTNPNVDLNRNFDYYWKETGSSDDPCEEIYAGNSPFSELETQAVRDFVTSHLTTLDAFITMHTYSQLWIYPYGDRRHHYPPDIDVLRATAEKGTKKLKSAYGTNYRVGTGADLLYEASGGSDDWAKSVGIKHVYLLELRPNEWSNTGFIVDRSQILPTGYETWPGLTAVFDAVLKDYEVKSAQ